MNVTNTGQLNGDDAVLLFLTPPNPGQGLRMACSHADTDTTADGNPLQVLAGMARINLNPGQWQVVSFGVSAAALAVADVAGTLVSPHGTWTARVGQERMHFQL